MSARIRETMHDHLLTGTFEFSPPLQTTALIMRCETCHQTFTAVSGEYEAARRIIVKKHRAQVA